MQPPYNDRWERTKRYLFRNLLENPGFCLSPIPEENRSESSDDRPYSPLPDLIIERERNRHDDSEEFYQDLEKRVKKYYKTLFIDGADCEDDTDLIADDDESSLEFEPNRRKASTFIIDANIPEDMPRQGMALAEIIQDPGDINISEDKTKGDSQPIESERRSHSSNVERVKINDFNVSRNLTDLNKEGSETIDNESDSTQTHHRISTTIAQIHEEVQRTRTIMRVFEDGSPVLLPKFYKFSRTVFGNVSDIKNAVRSEENSVLDDNEQDKIDEIETFDNIAAKSSQNEAKESSQLKTYIIDPRIDADLEVEMIFEGTKTVSNATEDSSKSFGNRVTDDNESEESHYTEDDEVIILENENEKTIDIDNDLVTTSKSEEEQSDEEESIGPNEFNSTELETTDKLSDEEEIIDVNKESFKTALKRIMFESKNKRKTSLLSTNEEIYRNQADGEKFDTFEVMRTNTQAELREAVRRESSTSQEDPVIAATQISAEKIVEDISDDVDEINASAGGMRHAQTEMREILLRESAASQDSPVIVVADVENLAFSDDFIDNNAIIQNEKKTVSSKCIEEATPRLRIIKSVADVYNDVTTSHGRKNKEKRGSDVALDAPLCKKKKHKSIETQTSPVKNPSKSWDCIKNDLFVGSPLILKLCGCPDHVCFNHF